MPIHDWTRVIAGTFHHFHCQWIAELSKALNGGVLPADYYAMSEQAAGEISPDVLTLRRGDEPRAPAADSHSGLTALADAPPDVAVASAASEAEFYASKRRRLVIRHSSDDSIVAILEIVSPGNKSTRAALRKFLDKATSIIQDDLHLLVIDLLPPGKHDPQGIHSAIWEEISDEFFEMPANKRLTVASYSCGPVRRAFMQPLAVGDVLPDMPLFLEPEWYVNLPLERTYADAYSAVPERWRHVLERSSES
jgi:hypothetical protein